MTLHRDKLSPRLSIAILFAFTGCCWTVAAIVARIWTWLAP